MSYLGGVSAIQKKIRAYLHQEYATPQILDTQHITNALADGVDLFGRSGAAYTIVPMAEIIDDLPAPIRESPQPFESWFATPKDVNPASIDAHSASFDASEVQS